MKQNVEAILVLLNERFNEDKKGQDGESSDGAESPPSKKERSPKVVQNLP